MNLSKHAELLRQEYEYEKAAFKRDSQTMGIERKKRRGDCWFSAPILSIHSAREIGRASCRERV